MAPLTTTLFLRCLAFAVLLFSYVSALQVTPNSPCASFCLDSNDLDYSDPNSSNTQPKDITCNDGQYQSEPQGQKFQRCLSCLQDSTFAQGKENDQFWFLYNLRYAFDFCILGFPNATGVGSSPCMTSTACGALEVGLKDGELNPLKSTQYSYCDVDGGMILAPVFDKCLNCVKAGGQHYYLANYLMALKAGCQQRPPPGKIVGLSSSVFSKTTVAIIDPTPTADPNANKGPSLPTTTIVIIAIGSVVFLLLASGCFYIQYRKRLARKQGRGGSSRRWRGESNLSFQCQTSVPRSTAFAVHDEEQTAEKPYPHHAEYMAQPDEKLSPAPASFPWGPNDAMGAAAGTGEKARKEPLPLHNLTTTLPKLPPNAHQKTCSPSDDYYYTTPTSTTSTRSTAPLLQSVRPYVPSEHGMSSPAVGGNDPGFSPAGHAPYTSPISGATASPLLSQAGWPLPGSSYRTNPNANVPNHAVNLALNTGRDSPVWETQRSVSSNVPNPSQGRSGLGVMNRSSSMPASGSPTETKTLQTSFPPPPSKKR